MLGQQLLFMLVGFILYWPAALAAQWEGIHLQGWRPGVQTLLFKMES